MQISLYSITIPTLKNGLLALAGILDKAEAYLKEKGIPESELLDKRFAPDMFPFVRQVQVVCDQAKGFPFRVQGKEPPSIEDSETTIAELKARVRKTLDILDTVRPEEVDENADAKVPFKYMPGKHLTGFHYGLEYTLPNFFFHLTTAYDLLRAEGVQIGKADFIGQLSLRDDA